MTTLTIDSPVRIDNATDPTSGALEPELSATVVVVVEGPQGPAGGASYDDTEVRGLIATEESTRATADSDLADDLATGLATKASALALSNEAADRAAADTALQSAVDGKAATVHTHAQGDVTGLTGALDAKVDDTDPRLTDARTPLAHTHVVDDVTDLPAPATDGKLLGVEAGAYALVDPPAGGGGGTAGPSAQLGRSGAGLVPAGAKAASGCNVSTGYMVASPIVVAQDTTLSAIGVRIATSAVGAIVRVGVYADDGTMRPGDLMAGSDAALSGEATGYVSAAISVTLPAGVYWVAAVQEVAAAVFDGIGPGGLPIPAPVASLTGGNVVGYATNPITPGSLPATWPGTAYYQTGADASSGAPRLILTVA